MKISYDLIYSNNAGGIQRVVTDEIIEVFELRFGPRELDNLFRFWVPAAFIHLHVHLNIMQLDGDARDLAVDSKYITMNGYVLVVMWVACRLNSMN